MAEGVYGLCVHVVPLHPRPRPHLHLHILLCRSFNHCHPDRSSSSLLLGQLNYPHIRSTLTFSLRASAVGAICSICTIMGQHHEACRSDKQDEKQESACREHGKMTHPPIQCQLPCAGKRDRDHDHNHPAASHRRGLFIKQLPCCRSLAWCFVALLWFTALSSVSAAPGCRPSVNVLPFKDDVDDYNKIDCVSVLRSTVWATSTTTITLLFPSASSSASASSFSAATSTPAADYPVISQTSESTTPRPYEGSCRVRPTRPTPKPPSPSSPIPSLPSVYPTRPSPPSPSPSHNMSSPDGYKSIVYYVNWVC